MPSELYNTLKQYEKIGQTSSSEFLETRIQRFLFADRTSPQSTTNQIPAELLMNRKLVTVFSLIKPDIQNRIKQPMPVCSEDFVHQNFKEGNNTWFRNYSGKGEKWLPGK